MSEITTKTRLWCLLREQGRSQAWLARRSGYSAVYVKKLANGRLPMTVEAAARLAPLLGVEPNLLLAPPRDWSAADELLPAV